MEVLLRKDNLIFKGSFIIDKAIEMKEVLMKTLEKTKNVENINIDLSKVEEIDSSAIQLIISFCKSLEQEEKKFDLINVNDNISQLLKLTGLNKFFKLD